MKRTEPRHWNRIWHPRESPFASPMDGLLPFPARGVRRGYRMVEDGELPLLFALQERIWGEENAEALRARWDWLRRNPHAEPGERTIPGYFRGNELRAYQINVPQRFLVRGRPWRVYLVGSLTADPATPGSAARLHAFLRDFYPVSFWGWAARALALYRRTLGTADYHRFPRAALAPSPYGTERRHASRAAFFHWPESPTLVRPLRTDPYLGARPLTLAANAAARSLDRVLLRQRGAIRVRELARFSSALDPWLRATAATHPFILDRDSSYLNWRFLDCPFASYRVFLVERGSGSPIGVAIVERVQGPRGHDAWRLSDQLTAHRRPEHTTALLKCVLREAHRAGVCSVRARDPQDAQLMRAYRGLGFQPRGADPRHLIFWRPPLDLEPETIAERAAWPVSWADGDPRLV